MKAKRNDIGVRELFRQKLDKAEVMPSSVVGAKLMRKLAIREFLHFTPYKVNVYYLTGLLVSAVAAIIIFTTGDVEPVVNKTSEPVVNESVINNNIKSSPVLSEDDFNRTEKIVIEKAKITGEKKNSVTDENTDSKRTNQLMTGANEVYPPHSVTDSFTKKGLLTEILPGMDKLQSGFGNEDLLFESSADEGCVPLKIKFSLHTSGYDSCRWTFGDGGYSTDQNPEWIFDIDGEFKVVVTLYGTGHKATSSKIISVHPRPEARFETAPEKVVLPEDEVSFYNYSTNGVKFRWDFGDGNYSDMFEPRHVYSKYGSYDVSLAVVSEFGCIDSVAVLNAFAGSQYFIEFPNAFIPNIQGPTGGYYSSKSDEAAQVFHPNYTGVAEYQLKIFSKLGILIFESNDINIGWDGYFNGQLCKAGVYIWKVRGKFRNGEPFTKMGDITLLKN